MQASCRIRCFLMDYSRFIWWNQKKDVSLQREKLCLQTLNISLSSMDIYSMALNMSLRCVNIKYVEQKINRVIIKKQNKIWQISYYRNFLRR